MFVVFVTCVVCNYFSVFINFRKVPRSENKFNLDQTILETQLDPNTTSVHIRHPLHAHTPSSYGRVFPSKTLRNVPAFARAFAQAYARASAGAKVKGGGVIPESGCEVGVAWV